jgi:putative hydrolase of the HAD superfamily
MIRKKYTHLFFDLDNTLWDFENNSCGAMQQTFSHFHLQDQNIDFNRFFDEYTKNNLQLWDEYRNGKLIKKDLTRLRFEQTLSKFGIKDICPDEMNAFYLDEMPGQKRLVDGAVELLDYLKSKGYALFILTNGFREVQHKKLEITGLKKYFTRIFISEEIKAPKPTREIFEYAIKSANAKKRCSLMIGDDLEVDVVGALKVGIDAVWFHTNLQEEGQKEKLPAKFRNFIYNIKSLPELKKIV